MTHRLSFALLSLLSTLSLAGGCKDRTEPAAGAAAAAPAAPPSPASPTAGAKPPKSTERSDAADPAAVKTEVLAALLRWVEVQMIRDFDAYAALYEPRTFRGVKRTSGGKVTDFDLAGWKADRKR